LKGTTGIEREFSFKLKVHQTPVSTPSAYTVLEVLCERLNTTAPKKDCSKGECGASTVLMNGKPVFSCLVLISQADGAEIVAAEGFMKYNFPNFVQKAFVDNRAARCGHCIP